MAIKNRFIFSKTDEQFRQELENISDESLVFIGESRTLYVKGEPFSQNSLFKLGELIESIESTELEENDTIPLAVIKLYKRLKVIDPENVSDMIALLIKEVNEHEITLNKRMDDIEEAVAQSLADFNYKIGGEAFDKHETKIKEIVLDMNKINEHISHDKWYNIETVKTHFPMLLVNKETNEKLITNRLANKYISQYEPIGLVVIPQEHDVYGTGECGVMALRFASIYNPEEGSKDTDWMYWGQQDVTLALTKYTEVPTLGPMNYPPNENITGTSQIYNSNYLPIVNDELWRGYESPTDKGAFYYNTENDYNYYIPSPYLAEDKKNPEYSQISSPSNVYNALSDFNGRENTDILLAAATAQEDWRTSMGHGEIAGTDEGKKTSDTMTYRWEVQSGGWYTEPEETFSVEGISHINYNINDDESTTIRCYFKGEPGDKIVFGCISRGEQNFDYLVIGGIDAYCDRWNFLYTMNGDANNMRYYTYYVYDNEEHYVDFCYSKDSSVTNYPDNCVIYISNGYRIIPQEPPVENYYGYGYSPAACCCWRYHTKGTNQGDWYLPAAGELGYIVVRYQTIKNDLKLIRKHFKSDIMDLPYVTVWSSTEIDNVNRVGISLYEGYVQSIYNMNTCTTIPFLKVKL